MQKYYNKCDRVLNETNELKSIGILLDNSLLDKAKETEEKTRKLIATMESKKEEIDITSQMYKFIDKVNKRFYDKLITIDRSAFQPQV